MPWHYLVLLKIFPDLVKPLQGTNIVVPHGKQTLVYADRYDFKWVIKFHQFKNQERNLSFVILRLVHNRYESG